MEARHCNTHCFRFIQPRLVYMVNAMSEPYCYYLRVRYAECDAQKVVFNSRYGDYVDLAMTEFLRALGFGAGMADGTIDFQLVKQTFEWKRPARFDQVLAISVSAKALGNTSFTLSSQFRIAGDPELIAVAETVYVFVDHALNKRSLSADFRAALERGAPGHWTDHADYQGPRLDNPGR